MRRKSCQNVEKGYKRILELIDRGGRNLWSKGRNSINNEEGMGTIELVLLICVLIALALMFKDTIVEFVADILGNISSQETVFDPGTIAK